MDEFEKIRAAKDLYQERRKKSDWIVMMATILSIISWAVVIAVWFVLEAASPDREMRFVTSLMQVHFDSPVHIREQWDAAMLPMAFLLLIVALAFCIAAFVFNKLRMRRKTDKYRKSVFIIGGITIIGIVAFLIRFGFPF